MRALIGPLVFAASLLSALSAMAQDTPRIVAVTYPLQYFAERLASDAAEVEFPVPEGVDPPFWRPSIADISAVQSADLILLNGAGFATWTTKVSLPRSRLVDTSRGLEDRLIATESVTHSHGDGGEHSHEGTASYLWLDPMLALRQAEAVAGALTARGIGEASAVEEALASLTGDLTALDEAARARLAGLEGTVIVATHPRYQYLARAYGLTVISLEWDAGAAPDAEQLAELEALVAAEDAKVLLWEALPPEEAREAVAALGLEDTVFPTFASPAETGDFIEAFGAAVDELAAAAERSASG